MLFSNAMMNEIGENAVCVKMIIEFSKKDAGFRRFRQNAHAFNSRLPLVDI